MSLLPRFARSLVVLLLVSAQASCVAREDPVRYADADEYALDIRPDAAAGAFLLSFESRSTGTLCVSQHNWPDRLGRLHMGADLAQVVVGDRTFAARDTNFGYCVGAGCTLRIAPGGRLTGQIAFAEFDGWDPATIDRTRLRFSVRPWACR